MAMKRISERSLLLLLAAVQFTHIVDFMILMPLGPQLMRVLQIMTLAAPASRRGAFMSLSGCARDLAMGVASSLGGWLVTKAPSGQLENFNWLGWIAVSAGMVSVWLGSRVRVQEAAALITASSLLKAKTEANAFSLETPT